MLRIGTGFPKRLDPASVVLITSPAQLEDLLPGTVVRIWDYLAVSSPAVMPPSALEPWTREADPLADAVVERLGLRPGMDALKALKDAMEAEPEDEVLRAFWDHVARMPPDGINAAVSSSVGCTPSTANTRQPAEPTLAEGQAVFWRYSTELLSALLLFSLTGGFSAPRLNATMRETGYLTSGRREATYRRLLETTLFVLDAMSDMEPVEGKGWKSAVRVRLLHAQVRRRVLSGKGARGEYSEAEHGLPINQEDLAAVLGAFAIAPLWALRRLGAGLTAKEEQAYAAGWRHVGYYLGVSEQTLLDHFGGRGQPLEEQEKFFASVAFDVFPRDDDHDGAATKDPTQTPQYKILAAISSRPPRNSTIGYHLEYSRFLLGPSLASALSLPRGTWADWAHTRKDMFLALYLIQFGRWYPFKSWDVRRQRFFKWVIELLTLYNLGERRTLFAERGEDRHEHKLSEKEGEGEPAGLEMGPHIGKRVRRDYRDLIVECSGVTAFTVGLLGWSAWKVAAWWY